MLGISSGDKDGDNSEKMGRLIISVDDNSVGGYHNEGGEDQTWHNVLMIWQKKDDLIKIATDASDDSSILLAQF